MKRRSIVAVISCAAATSALAAGREIQTLSSTLDSPKNFWRSFMQGQYGTYSKKSKCWVGKNDGNSFCMRPNTLERVTVGGKSLVFVTATGGVIPKDGGSNDCHACSGNIGYFVLEPTDYMLNMVAAGDPYLESGSYGVAPDEEHVKVRQIGAKDTFGWIEESSYTGQGYTYTKIVVKAVVGDQVRSIGGATIGFDDEGNCENGKNLSSGKPCSNVRLEPTFDTALQDRFSPIILRSTGIYEGENFERTFTVKFDEKRFLYAAPKDMPEDLQ